MTTLKMTIKFETQTEFITLQFEFDHTRFPIEFANFIAVTDPDTLRELTIRLIDSTKKYELNRGNKP